MTRASPNRGQQGPGTAPSFARRWVFVAGMIAAVVAVVPLMWALGRGNDAPAAQAPVRIEHVHGLGVNPADGMLYAAAHNGVFQLPTDGPARRVGNGQQDTMGFTVAGPNRFLASGHPTPGQGGPENLGLSESTDGGVTWRELSLSGGADFHVLRYRHDTVYGYNDANGQIMASKDRTAWQGHDTVALQDFVISPSTPNTLLATTQQGLHRSTDAGRTWTRTGASEPLLLLDWEQIDRLWGVTTNGELLRSSDSGTTWSTAGNLPGRPTAFAANGNDLYASMREQAIFHSSDAGATWNQVYP
jgi:hypothetical protein